MVSSCSCASVVRLFEDVWQTGQPVRLIGVGVNGQGPPLRSLEILHEGDPAGGCERACYDSLLSFYNQLAQERLARRLALPFLHSLERLAIEPISGTATGPSLAELMAQCQSDLERQVLQAIQPRGLPLPQAAQKTLYDGGEPIAIADFFYESRIAIFVDSSPHYRD